jgi:hypothetical protein
MQNNLFLTVILHYRKQLFTFLYTHSFFLLVQDTEILSDNILQTNLDFSEGTPNFEAVDLLALPEHSIMDSPLDKDAEHGSYVPSLVMREENLGTSSISLDPLLGVKLDPSLETGVYL